MIPILSKSLTCCDSHDAREVGQDGYMEQLQSIPTRLCEGDHTPPKFQYQPLSDSEIRLLKISPGERGNPIHCQIEYVPLIDNPVYIALSYVWGDASSPEHIMLNGCLFNVTRNLHTALDQLRVYCKKFTHLYVWIDAICIDQNSNNEKSHQVSRMTEVYGNSKCVMAWLGAIPEEEKPNMEALFQKLKALWQHEQTPKNKRQSSEVAANAEPLAPELYKPLRWLMGRPWFRRVWTLQEGSIGRYSCELHAGRFWAYMRPFEALCLKTFNLPQRIEDIEGCRILESSRRVRAMTLRARRRHRDRDEVSESTAANDLLLLLQGTENRKCLIPHDKVYGIVGLWKLVRQRELPRSLEPDYDHTFEQVCQQYAAYIISNTGDLDILSSGGNLLATTTPLWVPDLRLSFFKQFFYTPDNTLVSISANGQELTIRGCEIGYCIATMGSSKRANQQSTESWLADHVKMFEEKVLARAATIRNLPVTELRATWFHESFRKMKQTPGGDIGRVLELYEYLRLQGDDPVPESGSALVYMGFDHLARLLMEVTFEDDWMLLHNGHMARVFRRINPTKIGDILCLCTGSEDPLIIRAHGDKYRLMGHVNMYLPAWDPAAKIVGRQNDEFFSNRESKEYVII
jgi:hypothetical protein